MRIISEKISEAPLREIFLDQVTAFGRVYPEESAALNGELMLWGASVGEGRNATLWDLIEEQINYRVEIDNQEGCETSAEEFVARLFSPNLNGVVTADIIMARLQIG